MNEKVNFSPKRFMQQRRPDQFSDSFVIQESQLDSLKFEYALDNLSTKQQEYDFEEFARKLCQYEIQPNLRPQTGPAGGGDGKVDTETTPVSQEIRDIYYYGVEQGSDERWGFAFSTVGKKNLNEKIRSDVKKMMETGRLYTKVFFVTNRFLKDGKRKGLEDELTKKYNVLVTIHDGNWISRKVFDNKRESLAIDELNIDPSYKENKKIGPNDMARQEYFDDFNKEIEEAVQNNRVNFAIVENALSVVLIGAEMEKPKVDIEGLFTRAIRLAKKYGSSEQYFTARYQEVWTLYFWYEDVDILLDNYDEIELLTENTTNLFAVERLGNLLNILRNLAITTNRVEMEYVDDKKSIVIEKLEIFKQDESRPSASLHADFMLNLLDIPKSKEEESMNTFFRNLFEIVGKSEGLLGFPIITMYKMMKELNSFYSGNEIFEKLQDKLVEVVSERKSSTEAAHILMDRALQHIDGKRYYKAIDCLGRSLVPLYKEEARTDLIIALAHLSFAYESVGLIWAARSAMLHATSYSTIDFQKSGEINKLQLLSYARMRSIELLLGRVGYSLEWHNLSILMSQQFIKSDEEIKKLFDESLYYGCLLGCLLIKTDVEDLVKIESLPDTLINMNLDFAAYALIYRLQGEKALPEHFVEAIGDDDVKDFFNEYLAQPAQSELPDYPDFYMNEHITMRSFILGTEFIVKTQNTIPAIEIGEYILASLESFLATTMNMESIGNVGTMVINVAKDGSLGIGVGFSIDNRKAITFNVVCGDFNPQSLKKTDQEKLSSDVSNLVLTIVGHSISFRNPDIDLKKLFRDEEVGIRAFSFSSPLVVQGNVIGYKPKRSILDWNETDNTVFKYDSKKSGSLDLNQKIKGEDQADADIKKHDGMKNISIIQNHLWNEAGWSGVAYLTLPDKPPVLALMFKSSEKGKAIFNDWKDIVGNEDKKNLIRLSIVQKYLSKKPLWYKFLISRNMEDIEKTQFVINASRIHEITPSNSTNLDRFMENYGKFGYFLFAPAFVNDISKPEPEIFFDHGIVKKDISIRDAWEIGPGDQDISAITSDTEPVIPEDVNDPPILEILKKQRKNKQ